ncbi:MAG: hypothetical protein WD825_17255 [Gemmatimonadaceae bacterium]
MMMRRWFLGFLGSLVIAGATTAACAPAPATAPTPVAAIELLPALPDHVNSFAGPIAVVMLDTIPIAPARAGLTTLGLWDVANRTIWMRQRGIKSRVTLWQVLHHERCHGLLWDAGIEPEPELEERLCDLFATAAVRDQVERAEQLARLMRIVEARR